MLAKTFNVSEFKPLPKKPCADLGTNEQVVVVIAQ